VRIGCGKWTVLCRAAFRNDIPLALHSGCSFLGFDAWTSRNGMEQLFLIELIQRCSTPLFRRWQDLLSCCSAGHIWTLSMEPTKHDRHSNMFPRCHRLLLTAELLWKHLLAGLKADCITNSNIAGRFCRSGLPSAWLQSCYRTSIIGPVQRRPCPNTGSPSENSGGAFPHWDLSKDGYLSADSG
jgi:hypothetical protein